MPAGIEGEGASWRQGPTQRRSDQPEADKERGKGGQHPPIRSRGGSDYERRCCQQKPQAVAKVQSTAARSTHGKP